jgi:L-aspartate oxidase
MAWRAGAVMRDMEFMQFHPTVLYIAGGSRSLITEAVRGEGAYLVDQFGHRFMPQYDPRAELAPRDIVSQAIVKHMVTSRHSHVYLDMSHLDANYIRSRFPGIDRICQEFGLDITRDRIPVRPGAHYMIGGVAVDAQARTSIDRLWAAGEVTSSGLHGANRLASNSLLEGLVYGIRAGAEVSRQFRESSNMLKALPIENTVGTIQSIPIDVDDILNSLKSLMWRCAAVTRDADGLTEALLMVDRWWHYVMRTEFDSPMGWELQNMLAVCRMIIVSAQKRTESRGVHFRTDFPSADDEHWLTNVCIEGDRTFLMDRTSQSTDRDADVKVDSH